jgi:signal transduction histidine kinase
VSRWSIRARITVVATVLVAIVLVVLAVLVVLVQQAQLRANLDNSLEQRADQLVAEPAPLASNEEDRFVQVLDADGSVVAASANVAGLDAVVELPVGRMAVATRSDVPIEDDTYRILVKASDDRSRFVVVGENVDDVEDALRGLIVALAVLLPAALVALAGVIWRMVGRTLRPVDEMRREVVDIGFDRLDRRVPVPDRDDEVARLASTMNEMLARLDDSSTRQRQFVADVSHELRTPITRIRAALEVELAQPEPDLEAACRSVLDDAVEMQDLVDDLLFLARHDARVGSTATEVVDLDVIVDAEVRHQRAATPGIVVDMSAVSAAVVLGQPPQLARLVRNLLSNAVRHAAGRVVVTLSERVDPGQVVMTVDDDGAGIPAADRERIFERFVRLDEARRGGGAGLGLSIVRDIARAQGGSVEAADSDLGGARLIVSLPSTGT